MAPEDDEVPDRLFGGFNPADHEAEARARWGTTEAFRESARRTKRYSKADWERYKAESDALMADAAALLRSSRPAESNEAMALAERHRLSIDRWFYPCDPSRHAQLAGLYDADERFAAGIDRSAPGLTSWLSAAIRANALR
jgi:hypothetical protein